MSIRAELEDVADWISGLKEKQEAKPKTEPLGSEAWRHVEDNLKSVSKSFAEARTALRAKDPKSVPAEFADDLGRESEGLALRAHMLSRRAPEKPATKRQKTTRSKASHDKASDKKGPAKSTKGSSHTPGKKSAVASVELAARSVETAREKFLTTKPLDAVATAFAAELDVLAEMTLSLRQQCNRLDDA